MSRFTRSTRTTLLPWSVPLTSICTLQQLTLLQNTFENSDTIIPKITKKNAKEWDGDVLVKKHSWSFFIFNGRFR